MDQWSTPELPGRLERSFAAQRKIRLQWVLKKQPEVDRSVCCSPDREEDVGELLEGSRVFLDAQGGWEGVGEEVWSSGDFLEEMGRGVCGDGFGLW